MNKKQLSLRLQQVEQAIVQQNQAAIQANNQLNVLLGIKQECIHWLQQLDLPEMRDPEEQPVAPNDVVECAPVVEEVTV